MCDDLGIFTVFFRRRGELREITVHDRVLALETCEGLASKGFDGVELIGPHLPETSELIDEARERVWRTILAEKDEVIAHLRVRVREEREQKEEYEAMFQVKEAAG